MDDVELKQAKKSEECWARWVGKDGRVVVIEKVMRGRGIRKDHIRAKIIDETKVHYVDFDEVEPF